MSRINPNAQRVIQYTILEYLSHNYDIDVEYNASNLLDVVCDVVMDKAPNLIPDKYKEDRIKYKDLIYRYMYNLSKRKFFEYRYERNLNKGYIFKLLRTVLQPTLFNGE